MLISETLRHVWQGFNNRALTPNAAQTSRISSCGCARKALRPRDSFSVEQVLCGEKVEQYEQRHNKSRRQDHGVDKEDGRGGLGGEELERSGKSHLSDQRRGRNDDKRTS